MATYLEKLRSTLNEVQSKQISALLLKKKKTGEIASLEEFKTQLSKLTSKLLADTVNPSLEVFISQFGHIIDSDTFNRMLEQIKDDLTAIYSEADTIDQVLDSHINIVNNVILKSIRYGVAQLETKIDLLEFLNQDKNGFEEAQFNTFNTSENLTFSRTNKNSNILFHDPRSGDLITNDANIDIIGDRLSLGFIDNRYLDVKHVEQIFDIEATQSAELVSFSTNKISNIVDNTHGTYWLYSILQSAPNSNGILVKIKLELANFLDVNFLEIETASPLPMELVSIDYMDGTHTLTSMDMDSVELRGTRKVHFDTINTNEIHLVVRQKNPFILQYENKTIATNFMNGVLDQDVPADISTVETEIRNAVTSSKLLQDILDLDSSPTAGEMKKYYDYSVGFDNIKVGIAEYASKSIFVAQPLAIKGLNQLGLKQKSTRPFSDDVITWLPNSDVTDDDIGLCSIEYWAVLQNYSIEDELLSIQTIPLLPNNIHKIYHERLLLTEKVSGSAINNCGFLIFYAFNDIISLSMDYKVYRNGDLLTYATDWSVVSSLTNNVVPPNGKPNKVAIKIHSPSIHDFYTVSYTPLTGNTRANPLDVFITPTSVLGESGVLSYIVDLTGDASATLGQDNITYITKGIPIEYTKVYFVTILRRNTTNTHVTPLVDEYLLLASKTNLDKFHG